MWYDQDKMSGSITDAMEKGIRLSDVVVVVFSEGYFNSDSCRKECEYAARKGQMRGVLEECD